MSKGSALIIDDEPDIRELLAITLGRMGLECHCAASLAEAESMLGRHDYRICLTDMRLPDGNGIDFVTRVQAVQPDIPVAVITAHGNMESAIHALKVGAFDFLTKPVDLNLLRTLVNSALKLDRDIAQPSRELIGDSEAIRRVRQTVIKLSRSQAPVYISGESGTGKELVARLIHEQGPRSGGHFVPVNCGAIPHELMESEFFGYKKGSFTGAAADKQGLFQAADGGTLFLDEIAELSLSMQVKLLRAIQEKSIRPLGAQKEVAVDVRILSATHKDLHDLVRDGHFRRDLFYRIIVIELHVPPLRERVDDIPRLVDYILDRLCAEKVSRPHLTPAAQAALEGYAFPGNVRELENILERALTLCEGMRIDVDDLRLPSGRAVAAEASQIADKPLDSYLVDIEKQTILDALEKTRWNKTAAARLLGISFRALRYRLEKLGLD